MVQVESALAKDEVLQTGGRRLAPVTFPIFVVCRDRLAPLERLLDWLESAGQSEVYLVDNASSYPPLLDFYERSPHTVLRLVQNHGPTVVWKQGLLGEHAAGRRYVVTDFDVVPDERCPPDLLQHLSGLLDRYPGYVKAGPALRVDDLPDTRRSRAVRRWEEQHWRRVVRPGVYHAMIDTTFALYREGTAAHCYGPALRTGEPYWARHLPWYEDPEQPDAEAAFYYSHADPGMSSWRDTSPDAYEEKADDFRDRLVWRARWQLYRAVRLKEGALGGHLGGRRLQVGR